MILNTTSDFLLEVSTFTTTGPTWSITVPLSFDGTAAFGPAYNRFVATLLTADSDFISESNEVNVIYDPFAPDAPVILTVSTIANTNSFTISGTAAESSTITLTQNGNVLPTTTTAANDESWSIEVTLNDGINIFTATAGETAEAVVGDELSGPSDAITVTLDTAAPASAPDAPVITTTSETVNTNSFTISGTAAESSTITLTQNGNVLPTTTTAANSSGAWSIEVTLSPDNRGINTFTARAGATAAATEGNGLSGSSNVVTLTLDTTPPAAPVITQPTTPTNASTITISGSTEAGSTVEVSKGTFSGAATVTGTAWSIEVTLNDGINTFTATATDVGGTSEASDAIIVIFDSSAPNAPVITTASETVDTNSFTIEGTATATESSIITLTQNGEVLPTTTTAATDESWSIEVTLNDGINTFTARAGATAAATEGNGLSGSSDAITVIFDPLAPDAPVITTASETVDTNSFTISGTATESSIITLTQNGEVLPTTVTANSSGAWSIEVTLSPDNGGINTFTARAGATAAATEGNGLSGSSDAITVTLGPLSAPSISASVPTLMATAGTEITAITIDSSAGGTVASYGISPVIGNGLLFSTTSGEISGTPTAAAAEVSYAITATNTTGSDATTVSITVQAARVTNEVAPTFSSATMVDVSEGETAVITVAAIDAVTNDASTFSTTLGGIDASSFSITTAGVLTFNTTPDFEAPGSASMPASNVYTVIVTALDGADNTLTRTQTLTITITDVKEVLSVEALAGIAIYPNPSAGVIRLSGGKEAASYTLLDGSGQMLKKETLQAGKEDHVLTLAALPAGVYFLHVQTGKKSFTQKVIKR